MTTRKKILIIDADFRLQSFQIDILKEKHDVECAISTGAIGNVVNLYPEGFEYFDIIFLEPYFPPHPLFTSEETDGGFNTGWFIYKKFLENLKKPIVVIWTSKVQEYQYPNNIYPQRVWGTKVRFLKKGGDLDYLANAVENICL